MKAYSTPVHYCSGKVSYDKKGAVTAANARRKQAGIKLRIYPCPSCNRWHLTKTRVAQRRSWKR